MFDPSDKKWADLVPLPQDDGPAPVVPIAYSAEFTQVHDYFRAMMKKNEKSQRALELTAYVLGHNPANYTAWHYRRQCLKSLNSDLLAELEWCAQLAIESPKNYQLWHHRREIVTILNQPLDELRHVELVLEREGDAKNYHAWSHRQWVLLTFQTWENEMKFIDKLITEDVRNNSAWNHRHFVHSHVSGFTSAVLSAELEYCKTQIRRCVNNASPWNYLIGLMSKPQFGLLKELEVFAQGVSQENPDCYLSEMCLLEVYCKQARSSAECKQTRSTYCSDLLCFNFAPCPTHAVADGASAVSRAVQTCEKLANIDSIRRHYWQLRSAAASQLLGN
jgi:protein farnesyltransferase/geranylgeranyltransferase type-1 subunit alpha